MLTTITPPNSKEIPGHDGFYRVDIYGNIWSCRVRGGGGFCNDKMGDWRQIRPASRPTGHLGVVLVKDKKHITRSVHRLVLEAFVGPCPVGCEARHFPDRNPSNNKLSNLKWGTRKENQIDRVFHGTDNRGAKCGTAVLTWSKVRKIRRLYATGAYSYKTLSKLIKVNWSTLAYVIRGCTWKESC